MLSQYAKVWGRGRSDVYAVQVLLCIRFDNATFSSREFDWKGFVSEQRMAPLHQGNGQAFVRVPITIRFRLMKSLRRNTSYMEFTCTKYFLWDITASRSTTSHGFWIQRIQRKVRLQIHEYSWKPQRVQNDHAALSRAHGFATCELQCPYGAM